MTVDVKRLLRKKTWKAEEVCILEMESVAYRFGEALKGNFKAKKLVTDDQLQMMFSSAIKTPEDNQTYKCYKALHDWITEAHHIALAHGLMIDRAFQTMFSCLVAEQGVEAFFELKKNTPTIMTESQFKREIEQGAKNKGALLSVYDLIGDLFSYYINLLDESPRKKNPLKAFKKKFSSELITDNSILKAYWKNHRTGYYQLKDGRRSDELTDDEWKKAISENSELCEALMEAINEGAENILASVESKKELECNFHYLQITHKEHSYLSSESLSSEIKWIYLPPSEKPVYKWDFLAEDMDMFEYFDISEPKDMTSFNGLFPGLIKTLFEELKGKLPQLGEISEKDWAVEQLQEKDIGEQLKSYEGLYSYDTMDFIADTDDTGKWRPGVAVLKFGGDNSFNIDENGDFSAPDLLPIVLKKIGLAQFFTENEDYAAREEHILSKRKEIMDGVYFLTGYNTAIEMLAKSFHVPGIAVFKINDLEAQISKLKSLADFCLSFRYRLKNPESAQPPEYRIKKIEVLKNFYGAFDFDSLKPSKEKMDWASEAIANRDIDLFIDNKLTKLFCDRMYATTESRFFDDSEEDS